MLSIIVLFSFISPSFVVSICIDPSFTKEYFTQKNVKQIVVFACWNENEILNYYRRMIKSDTSISYNIIRNNLEMKKILKVNYYKLGIILDMDCPQSHIIFNQFSAAQLPFNESYVWLSVTTASDIPTMAFHKLPLTVESELTLVLVRKPAYILYDLYNHAYRHGGKLNVTSMGYWDKNGLKNYLTQYKYKRRQDFHGIPLNISIVLLNKQITDLEKYLTTTVDTHLDSMIRFHYFLILQLQDMYNFKINLIRHKTWGYLENGTFNGILGGMMKGIVDVSAAPFQYKTERLDACEFTVETYVVKPYFMFLHPKKSAVRNPFLKPFKQNVWWLLFNICLICWISLLLTIKVEKIFSNDEREFYSNISSETALITFAAISQQGLSETPRLYSGRIFFLTLFFCTLVMYQFYSASIVGSLIAPSPRFIKNIVDLANSDLHIGLEDTPYTKDHFKKTTDPDDLYLWKKKVKPFLKKTPWVHAKEGIHRVSKGGYAFFIDSATGYKIIEDTFMQSQICDLAEIELVSPQYVSITTSKNSPFKKMIIYGLRQIVQSGITRRLFNIWHHRKPKCPENFRSKPMPVEMQEFSPAIFLITGGFIVATIVMSAEFMMKRFLTRHCIKPSFDYG